MNVRTLARTALVAAAALAAVALASAQRPGAINPGPVYFQSALVLDSDSNNIGSIHRLNLSTGAYQGNVAWGKTYLPTSLAVQPSTGMAYVSDYFAIKRIDPKNGDYYGAIVTGSALGGEIEKLRFNSAGALYAVVKQTALVDKYRVFRINPATGAVLAASDTISGEATSRTSLGFRPDGSLEIGIISAGHTYLDSYTANLAYKGYTGLTGLQEVFRTSNDRCFRWRPADTQACFACVGNFSANQASMGNFASPQPVMFAEGASNYTYALTHVSPTQARFYRYNTNGFPLYVSSYYTSAFASGKFMDMAVYVGS